MEWEAQGDRREGWPPGHRVRAPLVPSDRNPTRARLSKNKTHGSDNQKGRSRAGGVLRLFTISDFSEQLELGCRLAIEVPTAYTFHSDGSNGMDGGTICRGLRKPARDTEICRHPGTSNNSGGRSPPPLCLLPMPEGAKTGVTGAYEGLESQGCFHPA